MGFFSWKTCDTERSICNAHSSRKPFTVHMITEDGQIFTEHNYDGYGEFGGKDVYALIAELNGLEIPEGKEARDLGITLVFSHGQDGGFSSKYKSVKFVEGLVTVKENWQRFWDSLPYPENCEDQGFFYSDFEDGEDEDEDY